MIQPVVIEQQFSVPINQPNNAVDTLLNEVNIS